MEEENNFEEIIEIEETAKVFEVGTLVGIFIEPGKTFQSMIKNPKFLIAGVLILLFVSVFQVALTKKIGFKNIVKAEMSANPFIQEEQKKEMTEQQSTPVFEYVRYGVIPIVIAISFLIGGLIYWLAGNAMGGSMTFMRGISVWVYASFAPAVISLVANFLVLFLKNVEDIDPSSVQKGLIQANPSAFIDGKSMPVLGTLLGSIDLFQIWGLVLAAIGLKVMGSLSTVSAWSIVIILALVGICFKVVGALLSGVQN